MNAVISAYFMKTCAFVSFFLLVQILMSTPNSVVMSGF